MKPNNNNIVQPIYNNNNSCQRQCAKFNNNLSKIKQFSTISTMLPLSRAQTLATRYYLQLLMYKVILKRLACILWLISSAYLALKVMQVRNKVSAEEEDVEDDIVATASKRSQMNHKTYLPRCWITEILFGLRADTHRSTAQLLIGDA